MKGILFYLDNYEAIRLLTYEQKGMLLDAAFRYALGENLPDMDAVTAMAFSFIRSHMDAAEAKYQETIKKRSEAGKRHKGNQYTRLAEMEQMEQVSQNGTNGTNTITNTNTNTNTRTRTNITSYPATYEERLKSEAVMLQAIANSAATTPQAVIAMLPDFADQLRIDGKKHKNYAEWRKHLQNYILKRKEKQRNNGNTDNNNKPFEPAGGIDYSRTDF